MKKVEFHLDLCHVCISVQSLQIKFTKWHPKNNGPLAPTMKHLKSAHVIMMMVMTMMMGTSDYSSHTLSGYLVIQSTIPRF